MTEHATPPPTVRLKPKADRRVRSGHPWVYSNEIEIDATAKALPPGSVTRLLSANGQPLGTFLFNRHPLIAARRLTVDPDAHIDVDFIAARLERALSLRERLITVPFYRLVHAEADGLPGTVIDRFGDALVVQINTAGMDLLREQLLAAIDRIIAPRTIVLRNDSPARALEGLPCSVETLRGNLGSAIELSENGGRFLADLGEGQKTGWFFDQRDNRAWVASLIRGSTTAPRVLDAYCFTGGFAIQAALAGAREVLALDRSRRALELAGASADLNDVSERLSFRKSDVFAALEALDRQGERFDWVIADPPAFVKHKKDLPQGLRAYRKLARLAARLVAPDGFLLLCSCSYHVEPPTFAEQVRRGLHDAGRFGRILRSAGAAPDHPVHPFLPESDYLKAQFLALD